MHYIHVYVHYQYVMHLYKFAYVGNIAECCVHQPSHDDCEAVLRGLLREQRMSKPCGLAAGNCVSWGLAPHVRLSVEMYNKFMH